MTHPLLAEVHAYWRSRLDGRSMPARADLDPTDIPSLLPHLMLTDVLDDGRYRFRLVGTEVERNFGAAMTGRTLEELMYGDYLAYITAIYDRVVRERQPVYTASRYAGADGESALFTHRVALPLSSDGTRVDIVLSAQVFQHVSELDGATAYRLQHAFDTRAPEAGESGSGVPPSRRRRGSRRIG